MFFRFGLMGIYVVMFLGVLKTLARALLVFACLIIAFSLAFHVLLPLSLYPDDADFFEVLCSNIAARVHLGGG